MDNFCAVKGIIRQIGERLNFIKSDFQWTAYGSQAVISKDAGGQSHKIGIGGIIDSNAREIFRIPSSSAFLKYL